MTFYLASSLDNIENAKKIIAYFVYKGWTNTHDWTSHGAAEGRRMLEKVSQWEMEGIKDADVFLLLLPGGRGSHVELGAALALGKPSLIISLAMEDYFLCERPCSFHHHPDIQARLFHPNIVRLSSMAQRKAAALVRKNTKPGSKR